MVPHSLEGLGRLFEVVEQERAKGGFDRAIFFMEATSYYWQNVANVLEARQSSYRLVSALSVDRQREIEHQTYAKGDHRDAELIARLGHQGQWLDRRLEHERLWLDLRALGREHDVLLVDETAERLRIRSLLGLVIPEFLESFKNPLAKTARAVLRRLSQSPEQLPATIADVRGRLDSVSGYRLCRAKMRAFAARLEGPSFGVPSALASTLARIGLALDRFEFLAEQRASVRARLVTLYGATPYRRVLDTIPGVGPENHALLLGIIGDPKRYDRASCLVKLAGLEPRENHSGEGEGAHSISRRGQAPLRHLLHRIVIGLSVNNEEFGAYVLRLQKREANPLKRQQAVVAAGNKYLRVVHHLCVREEVYRADALRT
jgi:transposase